MVRTTTRKSVSILLAMFMMLAALSPASADTLTPSSSNETITEGASSKVNITLTADAVVPYTHPNCDVQGNHQVLVKFTVDNANATVLPAEHLFTSCGETIEITIAGVTAGSATVTGWADMSDTRTNTAADPHQGDPPSIGFKSAVITVTVESAGPDGDEACDDPAYAADPANGVECGVPPTVVCAHPAAPAIANARLSVTAPKLKSGSTEYKNIISLVASGNGPEAWTVPSTAATSGAVHPDAGTRYARCLDTGTLDTATNTMFLAINPAYVTAVNGYTDWTYANRTRK